MPPDTNFSSQLCTTLASYPVQHISTNLLWSQSTPSTAHSVTVISLTTATVATAPTTAAKATVFTAAPTTHVIFNHFSASNFTTADATMGGQSFCLVFTSHVTMKDNEFDFDMDNLDPSLLVTNATDHSYIQFLLELKCEAILGNGLTSLRVQWT